MQQVDSAQRRTYFRVHTDHEPMGTVLRVARSQPDEARNGAAARGGVRVEGDLIDLSGGGIGIKAPGPTLVMRRWLTIDQGFRCLIQLADVDEPIELTARVASVRAALGQIALVGLEFDLDDSIEDRAIQDHILRFATEMQRRQLQHARAVGPG